MSIPRTSYDFPFHAKLLVHSGQAPDGFRLSLKHFKRFMKAFILGRQPRPMFTD
jgi:hypothetical protein